MNGFPQTAHAHFNGQSWFKAQVGTGLRLRSGLALVSLIILCRTFINRTFTFGSVHIANVATLCEPLPVNLCFQVVVATKTTFSAGLSSLISGAPIFLFAVTSTEKPQQHRPAPTADSEEACGCMCRNA